MSQDKASRPNNLLAACAALVLSMSGHAYAAIDRGYMINGVSKSSEVIPTGPISQRDEIDTVSPITVSGVRDEATGLTWIKADSLAEGQAQGYRAATSAEFSAFLAHNGRPSTEGNTAVYDLTTGFDLSKSTKKITSGSYIANLERQVNVSNISFPADSAFTYVGAARTTTDFSDGVAVTRIWDDSISSSLGWLDGTAGGNVGAFFVKTSQSNLYEKPNGSIYYTANTDDKTYTNKAFVGSWLDLKSGEFDAVSFGSSLPVSQALPGATPASDVINVKYFMVASSVPEPSSLPMMALGLAALAWVTRVSRHRYRAPW